MSEIKHPAIRYHGGKFRLAPWVISHFPAHTHYVEPFGGAASVLLRKERSYAEVYNDLDGDVVNLFFVLRDMTLRECLIESLIFTPYSRDEFTAAYGEAETMVEKARRLVIRATMGFGSAGATKGTTGFRLDTKRSSATAQHLWARMPENLAAVGQRFEGVLVENRDAVQCMLDHDTVSTLHFVDPPYVHDTRVISSRYYRHEMDNKAHLTLLDTVNKLEGMVVLSGYNTDMYNDILTGWQKQEKQSSAAGRKGSVRGRSVPTVNYCLACVKSAFMFAAGNGYSDSDPTSNLVRLRKSKPQPDPITRDEFFRMLDGCTHQQIKNLWTLAVYTGMRHGELCALAWEDIDLEAGTIMVKRNLTRVKQFTLPKTDAGTDRIIQLTDNAKEALHSQMLYTRMGPQYQILIHTREARKTREDSCTFVFIPRVTSSNQLCGDYYSTESLGQIWNGALRRSGVRSRKPYQSRHTFACWLLSAGANPSFIASQMGHASAQMVFSVYGEWMPESNDEQIALLNAKFSQNAPLMPHKKIG